MSSKITCIPEHELKVAIFDTAMFSAFDGPGSRVVVFLKVSISVMHDAIRRIPSRILRRFYSNLKHAPCAGAVPRFVRQAYIKSQIMFISLTV